MGAIAGARPVDGMGDTVVRRMLAAAPHRGPVLGVVVHGACALGVSASPVSADASLARRGRLAAAFSGILDNLAELATELGSNSEATQQLSAADVLLTTWEKFGEAAPVRLRGTFAAAVTDGERLWAFRDHIGFRSLFYRCVEGHFYLASEPKQVLAGAAASPEPDMETLERIFFADLLPDAPAALKGVSRLPNATLLVSDGNSLAIKRYWDPERVFETARLSQVDLKDRFEELMSQAARRAVTGRDAVSLSGGIDSPAVAAFAAPVHLELTGAPLAAVSAVYPHLPTVDERTYIELVAAHLGLRLHTYEMKAAIFDGLDRWAWLLDGPVQAGALAEVEEHFRLTRQLGYRTLLTGEVAESVFALKRYLLAHLLRSWRLGSAWTHVQGQRSSGMSVAGIFNQLGYAFVPGPLAAMLQRLRRTFKGRPVPVWLDERRVKEAAAEAVVPAHSRWITEQLAFFGPASLSMESDEVCQAVTGLSVRRPWADVDLWEFFLSLPAEVKFPAAGSKVLVRRLLRGRLPDEILDRQDKTFFDAAFLSNVDYGVLRRWLADPSHRLAGVRYELLKSALDAENMGLIDLVWARDLASIHAFLSIFEARRPTWS